MSRVTAPGYSIDLSDAVRVAGRRIRGLGGVVPINFSSGKANEKLIEWHQERSNQFIREMQLRREREGPYFHQFIVFQLRDKGGLYRVDRRLRPNEGAPLNSLKDEGIPAFDTIEPVASWDDPLFIASDCLISIEFTVDVPLLLMLNVCRWVHLHPRAKVYTLQRYNCYFFAQTLLLCVVCGASDWYRIVHRLLSREKGTNQVYAEKHVDATPYRSIITPATFVSTIVDPNLLKNVVLTQDEREIKWGRKVSRGEGREMHCMRSWRPRRESIEGTQELRHLVDSLEIFWNKERTAIYEKLVSDLSRKIFSSLWNINLPTNTPSILPANMPSIDITQLELNRLIEEAACVSLERWRTFLETWETQGQRTLGNLSNNNGKAVPGIHMTRSSRIGKILNELTDQIEREHYYVWSALLLEVNLPRVSRAANQAVRIRFHSFKQNMIIRINSKEIQARYQESDALDHDLQNVPQHNAPQSRPFWRRNGGRENEELGAMVESTIIDMQQCVDGLIQAHSKRVEAYKWLTKADAQQVASDIRGAMDEVWNELIG